jgi:hypothetical protein
MIWLALLLACTSEPRRITGLVIDRDTPVDAAPVQAGTRTTITDARGQYRLEVYPGTFPPVTAIPTPDRAHSNLSCGDAALLDVTVPIERPTATLAFILHNAGGRPDFDVHYATMEGTERDPVEVRWDLPSPVFERDPRDNTLWTATMEVPVAARWAVAVSALVQEERQGDTWWVVDQVLITTGDALGRGEVRYVEGFLSDETRRETRYWDTSGPGGVEEAVFLQQVQVDDFLIDMTTLRGPSGTALPVPVFLLRSDEELLGFRATFRYGAAGMCASRVVGMTASLVDGPLEAPSAAVPEPPEFPLIRFEDPLPEPPILEIDKDDTLSWSLVPREGAALNMDLRGPNLRWTAVGEVGCPDEAIGWPTALDPRGNQRITGSFGWTSELSSGTCEIDSQP